METACKVTTLGRSSNTQRVTWKQKPDNETLNYKTVLVIASEAVTR